MLKGDPFELVLYKGHWLAGFGLCFRSVRLDSSNQSGLRPSTMKAEDQT